MADLIYNLMTYGKDLFIHHTSDIIAILDREGSVIEANDRLKSYQSQFPETKELNYILAPTSHPDFQSAIEAIEEGESLAQTTLNFLERETKLPIAYNCWFILIDDKNILLYGDLIPPLDRESYQNYVSLAKDLAERKQKLEAEETQLKEKIKELEDKKIELEKTIHIDKLTKLPNRLSILSYFEQQVKIARRYKSKLSLFILNFDDFKHINDSYGYEAGDEVILHGVEIMKRAMRTSDFLGRYSGDEFIGVLPETDVDSAKILAERIISQIASSEIAVNKKTKIKVTVSMGLAQFDPNLDRSDSLLWKRYSLLWRVDNTLLQAKEKGGNQLVVWQETMEKKK